MLFRYSGILLLYIANHIEETTNVERVTCDSLHLIDLAEINQIFK